MKAFIIFIAGFLAGIFVTILFTVPENYSDDYSSETNDNLRGLIVFPEKSDCITKQKLKIFQVIKPNMALAETGNYPDGIMVLLINYNNKSYYDEQKITIPTGKCAKQIGTYKYTTKMEIDKTVPAVVIE